MRSPEAPGEAGAGLEALRSGAREGGLVVEARIQGLGANQWGLEKVVRSCWATGCRKETIAPMGGPCGGRPRGHIGGLLGGIPGG